ncbi:hypothetical protein D9M72_271670 [compost metagenome]
MFGVDEGTGGTLLLGFCNDGEGQGGLAGGFGTVDLDDTAFRQTTDAKRDVQAQGTGGNGRDGLAVVVAHAHDRPLAELLLDLAQGSSQGALLVLVH